MSGYRLGGGLLVLAAVLGLSACQGQPRYDGRMGKVEYQDFEVADRDQNGRLDREEVGLGFPDWAPHFERIDSDASGYLSWSEARSTQYPVLRPPARPGSQGY